MASRCAAASWSALVNRSPSCRVRGKIQHLLLEPALEIALNTGHIVYDCCYLALSMLMESQLITADQRLFHALCQTNYAPYLVWVSELWSWTHHRTRYHDYDHRG